MEVGLLGGGSEGVGRRPGPAPASAQGRGGGERGGVPDREPKCCIGRRMMASKAANT